MQIDPLGHLSSSFSGESWEDVQLREAYRRASQIPAWQLLVIACDDGMTQVSLRQHQEDKSVRADLLLDEVMYRYAKRNLPDPESIGLLLDAEHLTLHVLESCRRLEGALAQISDFPEQATHPAAFIDAARHLVSSVQGFERFQSGVKSGGPSLRKLLYPSPPAKAPLSVMKYLAAQADPDGHQVTTKALSDSALAVKTLQMIESNRLTRPGSMVYGTKTLRVYLPVMLKQMLDGEPVEQGILSLGEYVDSARKMLNHLQRCKRQIDLILSVDPAP